MPGLCMEVWRTKDGAEIAVRAASWEVSDKITFESLASEFRANPVKAWRNYGSIVAHNIENAIRDSAAILAGANPAHKSPWDHSRDKLFEWFQGESGVRYFMHFDLSKNRDATGIALAHRTPMHRTIVDFMLRIEARMGRNIDYGKLRSDFVYELTSRGFHIQMISYDIFQSEETQQILREKGYETQHVSADKSPLAYDTLIEQILSNTPEQRYIDYYAYPPFIRELEELKLVSGLKYDHPAKSRTGQPGSKDVSDAVACAILSAMQYDAEHPAIPAGTLKVFPAQAQRWAPVYDRGPF
jgi:hypothetical protein